MHNWFECKIKYQKIDEATGKDKTIKEAHLIDAVSFTEAEERTYRLLEPEVDGEFVVTNISPAKYNEVFFDEEGETWFKCKVVYIDVDQNNGKERKTSTMDLVFASNIKDACQKLEKQLSEILIPWECTSIAETALVDIFPYDAGEADQKKVEGMTRIENVEPANAIEDFENDMAAVDNDEVEELEDLPEEE